jgi:hypothetical protein
VLLVLGVIRWRFVPLEHVRQRFCRPGPNIFGRAMPHAKLTVTIPERVWVGDLSRRFPDAIVRVLAAFPNDRAGIGLAQIEADDLKAVLCALQEYEDLTDVCLLQEVETNALVQFETTLPLLLLPARDSGVPLEMPIEIIDGTVEWDLTAPRERLSELSTQLDQFDITYRVEYVRERVEQEQLLTERQRRLLTAGIEAGYYDTPRETSLTQLAEDVGVAKSTASETLHRAEEKIIKEYLDSLDARPATP